MKYLPLPLLLVAFPAFAATSFNASGLVATVVELIIIGVVCGILILLVRKAPFVPRVVSYLREEERQARFAIEGKLKAAGIVE